MEMLDDTLGNVTARSPIIRSDPVGPSQRHYANAALLLDSVLSPAELLHCLQRTEAAFGRIRLGQRWRARVLDLDIIMWSGGIYATKELLIPHPRFRERGFVLGPAAKIAPDWRDPVSGRTLRQLAALFARRGQV